MSTIKSSAEDLTLNADGSGNDIKFQSNAVEKASIDQDGNVAASGTITANGQAQLSNNNLIGGNTGATSTWIGKRTSSGDGVQIQTTNASGVDTQRLAITCNADSADFTIKDSDIVFGTAGKGICLGVTSNTDANTLEDYEEGTWTPEYDNNSNDLTRVMYENTGTYTKIGNMVFIQGTLATESLTSSAIWMKIDNLPFAIATDSIGGIQITTAETFGDDHPISGLASSSSSGFILNYRQTADAGTNFLAAGDMSNTSSINQNRARFFGNYIAA